MLRQALEDSYLVHFAHSMLPKAMQRLQETVNWMEPAMALADLVRQKVSVALMGQAAAKRQFAGKVRFAREEVFASAERVSTLAAVARR